MNIPARIAIAALTLAALPAAAQLPSTGSGQAYPAKTVRVIVPYPPGGGNDIIGRAIADELTRRLGQTFFVDNRPGASTAIGAELAARAPADGYHLFVASQTTFATVPNFKAKLPYDPVRDFEPVSLLAIQPYLIVVHPSLPVRTVKELIAMAKAQHIPYKGSGPAVADLLGGQVSLMFSTAGSVHTQVTAGKLRAVAITSAKRHVTLPNLPTVAETLPGFEISQWIAMHAPRATPRDITERLNSAVAAITQAKGYRERMLAQGYDAEASTPQQLTARIHSELARFGKLIKAIGLKDDGV